MRSVKKLGLLAAVWSMLATWALAANITVATVADLATARPGDGDVVTTLGYSVAGTGANTYRYDADSAATVDYGFVLDGPGSVGRYIAIDRSIVRATQFGARNAIGSDDGVALQRAIDAAEAMVVASGGSWGGHVLLDVQWCQFTAQLTVEQNGIVIRGLGSGATQVAYVSATGAAITFSKGASGISQCGIEKVRMQCVDTAGTKQGIVMNGAMECFVRDVYCPNWQGTDAVFLQVSGHEMMEFTKLDITATIPIRISESPIGAIVDCDHFHFTDCLLRHGASTKAGHISALVWAHVLIDAGVYVSNLTFDGSNAFVGGEYGIYQARTDTTKSVNHNISIKNARFEQPAESTGYAIYLAGNASVYTQAILLEGIRVSTGMKGIFIDYAINARITDYVSAIATNALTVDHLAHLELLNMHLTSGAAAMSMGTMTMLHGDRMSGGYGTGDYFSHAVWTSGGASMLVNTIQALTANSATPSVANASLWRTANSSGTTVTALTNGVTGQSITVLIGDANTTIDFTGTTLKGNNGVDWTPASGDHMTCTYDGTNWYCNVSEN